jgi:hypothetical protein
MLASLQDILDTVKSNTLTYQQKLMCLGNIAERLFDPRELLGYTDEEWQFLQNQMICDLNEGYAIYRPRYILPDYNVYIKKGCEFLELPAPKDLDEALDGLLILKGEVPLELAMPRISSINKIVHTSHKNTVANYDKDLFARLRFLRKQLADKENIPPYIVFNDLKTI